MTALVAIAFTGVAVRVTGSGLGCPTWPQCYENRRLVAEADTHAWIEFGNRLLTFVVGFAAILPLVAARCAAEASHGAVSPTRTSPRRLRPGLPRDGVGTWCLACGSPTRRR